MLAAEQRLAAPAADEPDTVPLESPAEEAVSDTPVAPPIKSRFLFVNVAGKRATQLRRGAKPRVEPVDGMRKAEHLAMEEVRRGLIPYDVVE